MSGKMNDAMDKIELLLPFKAEYVSIARLTASGVANRMGFDIESIEDIKIAVAEVCNKLISTGSESADCFKIVFNMSRKKLEMVFDCVDKSLKNIFKDEESELGISIINALMDDVRLCPDNAYILSVMKSSEGNTHNDR